MVNSRVLLNRHKRQPTRRNLFTNYPRYLVPNPEKAILETLLPESEGQKDKLQLDNTSPKERQLFMMTDFEAQKKRFGQRMKCRILK